MSRSLVTALMTASVAGSLLVAAPAFAKKHEAASQSGGGGNDPVVAIVNGDAIHRSEVEAALKQMLPPGKTVSLSNPQVFDQVRNDLISRKLAYIEAQREGLQNTPEVKHAEAMAMQQIVTGAFFNKVADNVATEDKMRQAYDEAIKTQPKQEELHMRQIDVKTEDDAKDIIKQLDGGADFQKLAQEKSINKGNAQDGGDIGYVTKSALAAIDPAFAETVFTMPANSYSKVPVKVGPDFHVIQALDKRPAKIPTFEEARPQLKQQLMQRAVQQKIVELAKTSKIQAFNIDGSPETSLPPAAPAQAPAAPASAPSSTAPAQAPAGESAPLQLPQTQPAP